MTLRLNHNNSQMNTIKLLKAAQSRAVTFENDRIKKGLEIQNELKDNSPTPTRPSPSKKDKNNLFSGAEQTAKQNSYEISYRIEKVAKLQELGKEEKELKRKEDKARNKAYSLQQKTSNPNTPKDVSKSNSLLQHLPKELKDRSDIEAITKNVDTKEAISDPDKAVQGLVDQALMGNKKAFMKLNEYSKNQFEKLQDSAGKGMEKVAAGADGKPKVLEMIAGSATDKSNEAATKLMHLVDKNPRAQQGFDRLLKNNAINFTKVATEAKNIDPASTASSINTLMTKGSLSKTDKKGAVEILGQIAKESPTGAGSKDAAKGLTRAVMKEPMDIAKKAAVELKEATINGNVSALNGLQTIAKSNDSSKAQLGLTQLGEIANSGASSATESITSIKEAAQDPTNSGKSKKMAVSILSNISKTKGTNSKEALNTLSSIATNKNNPANSIAFNEIGKTSDSKISNSFKTRNTGKQNSLSDSETYKKLMNLQTQMNSLSQKHDNFLNVFGSKLFQT